MLYQLSYLGAAHAGDRATFNARPMRPVGRPRLEIANAHVDNMAAELGDLGRELLYTRCIRRDGLLDLIGSGRNDFGRAGQQPQHIILANEGRELIAQGD